MSNTSIVYHPALQWPAEWPRTTNPKRSAFADRTLLQSIDNLRGELRKFGAKNIIVTVDFELRRDGEPASRVQKGWDQAVTVYFEKGDAKLLIPCDQYDFMPDNVHAICLCVEAYRSLERHCGGNILTGAMQGFAAIESRSSRRGWWDILECSKNATPAEIRTAYSKLVLTHHPDHGGDGEKLLEINDAYQDAMEAVNRGN